jgi:hypothetical protein
VRRLKTYSAQCGYVYQYFYEGQRAATIAGGGTEFVFTVSADRTNWRPHRVLLPERSVSPWEAAHARKLSMTERYAVAKIALFRAFDERDTPTAMQDDVTVDAESVGAIIETLEL